MLDRTRAVTLDDLRQRLADDIYEATNGVVQDGPFRGMQIYPDRGWPASNIVAELLGFHEQELHEDLEAEIARLAREPHAVVVNVGCAEGYYAVGLGRRLPTASVHALDIDSRSIFITLKNAEVNGVRFGDAPLEDALEDADLIVMDCEGAEYGYLDPVQYPNMKRATIIVEMHPLTHMPPPEQFLYERFHETHSVRLLSEGGRDPNRSPLLRGRPSLERWLAVCEWRPCLMGWAVLRPL